MKSVEFNKEEIDGFIKNNRMKYITISLAIRDRFKFCVNVKN